MTFGQSLSIADFKAKHNAGSLDVVLNPKTGKLFVTANGKTVAAVSKNYDSTLEHKAFVEIIDDETSEILWCLHNSNTENIKDAQYY